ncbi:MAG: polyphosphate polymerase domain-containing protein [Oscillospiraceae bacterium]|nr:polyphosphate polymerase domain-containing protein [Oscillospiraceae bacterium]
MGETKLTFKRYEKKYLLSADGYARLTERMADYIEPDEYHRSTVCSIYYDRDDYRLIRHSIDAPIYKEKLRVRSYNPSGPDCQAFVELKKKYKGIVYKRRIAMTGRQAAAWLSGAAEPPEDSQMVREIQWFLHENEPHPKVMIACDRTSWRARENPELRITFDEHIRWRDRELSFEAGDAGELLLPDGEVLMELKIPGAAPLWLAHLLSEQALFPTSFSKYGVCYKNHLLREYLQEYSKGEMYCV